MAIDFNTGILFDDMDIEKLSSKQSREVLNPSDEDVEKVLKVRQKGKAIEIPLDLEKKYEKYRDSFDPSTASKKEIRAFRKVLSEISNFKYPKKSKKKK